MDEIRQQRDALPFGFTPVSQKRAGHRVQRAIFRGFFGDSRRLLAFEAEEYDKPPRAFELRRFPVCKYLRFVVVKPFSL